LKKVAGAAGDPDVFVRRMALRALAASKDPTAIPAVAAALNDSENSTLPVSSVNTATAVNARIENGAGESSAMHYFGSKNKATRSLRQ
jgi:HEAT repeat protein